MFELHGNPHKSKTLIYQKWKFLLREKSSPLISDTAQMRINAKLKWFVVDVSFHSRTLKCFKAGISLKIVSGQFFSIVKLYHFRKTEKNQHGVTYLSDRKELS